MSETSEEITNCYDGLVAIVNDRRVLMEGPLARQFHDALYEENALKQSEAGLALESTMVTDNLEMGSLWFALAGNKAYLYATDPERAGMADSVRFKSVVAALTPEQRDLSALYIQVNPDPDIHDSQLWISAMERTAQANGVTVIRNVDDYLKVMNSEGGPK